MFVWPSPLAMPMPSRRQLCNACTCSAFSVSARYAPRCRVIMHHMALYAVLKHGILTLSVGAVGDRL